MTFDYHVILKEKNKIQKNLFNKTFKKRAVFVKLPDFLLAFSVNKLQGDFWVVFERQNCSIGAVELGVRHVVLFDTER